MKTEDLKYILETLEYGINNCSDDKGDTTTHFNRFQNSINLVERELRKPPIHNPGNILNSTRFQYKPIVHKGTPTFEVEEIRPKYDYQEKIYPAHPFKDGLYSRGLIVIDEAAEIDWYALKEVAREMDKETHTPNHNYQKKIYPGFMTKEEFLRPPSEPITSIDLSGISGEAKEIRVDSNADITSIVLPGSDKEAK